MEACSVTITGTLAFDPQPGKTQSGDPKLTITLKVQTRSNRTRWIKVRAFGLLAVRSAESYHQGDRVTVRADDLDSWGKVDDRPDSRFQGTGQDNGPRVQSWVFLTAYDIAMSTANDTAISGQSARRAAEPGEDATDENGVRLDQHRGTGQPRGSGRRHGLTSTSWEGRAVRGRPPLPSSAVSVLHIHR